MRDQFVKNVLAVVVGVFFAGLIATALFFLIFVGSIIKMAASDDNKSVETTPGSVMVLKVNQELTEVPPSMPFTIGLMGDFSMNNSLSLRGYINAVKCAQADPNIVGIYLNTDGMAGGPASLQALRHALADFRKSGKWIMAYNDNYSMGQYYVSSVADSIFVNTIGNVELDGMTTVLMYPKQLMDKLGVNMQVVRVGKYKSAVEMYLREHISDENKEQVLTYQTEIWNDMLNEISESRNISVEKLNDLANEAVSYMQPEEIAETGLVSGQIYKTDMESKLLAKIGQTELKGHAVTGSQIVDNYDKLFPAQDQKVAVYYAVGEIASAATGDGSDGIFYDSMVKDVTNMMNDESIKAVVLRVNSPGGSGFASEQIWKALADLKAKKPLVVSMGDYAASGGYYISCLANYIYAEPQTITGSIGVFGTIPEFSGIASKLGVNFEEVKTHELGTLTTMRPASAKELEKLQKGVESFYEIFTKRCADGRGIAQDSIKEIGGGRVWTGLHALQIGLVDELGGLNEAVQKAAELANLEADKFSTTNFPAPLSTMEQLQKLLKEETGDITIRIADYFTGMTNADREALRFIRNLKDADRIQARSFDSVKL